MRRSRLDVIADMLRVCNPCARKTRVMYVANMSFSQVQKYLDSLILMKLVRYELTDSGTIYYITAKGICWIDKYDDLIETGKSMIFDSVS